MVYYGRLKREAGRPGRSVELDGEAPTVDDLVRRLEELDFASVEALEGVAFSVGDELVDRARTLREGERVGLLPPVSGG